MLRNCLECDTPFPGDPGKDKKFCGDRCRARHDVNGIINQINKRTFTVAEAATKAGLSESTVRKRIKKNRIETFSIGRGIRVRRSAVRLLN